jgi:hypothetical protein
MKNRFYVLKIKLMDIDPPIWRDFAVPADITLDRLHDVVQIVMGWTDSHLYQFTIGKKRYTEHIESEIDGLDSGKYRLGDLVKKKGWGFGYIYDFGDGWEHYIVLEESRYNIENLHGEIVCLDGERACPPEDVGGVMGYNDLCEVLNDPDHEDYESTREWAGKDYYFEKFDIQSVNFELMKYMRWSRDRYLPWKSGD